MIKATAYKYHQKKNNLTIIVGSEEIKERLTADINLPIWQRKQGRVQWMLGVSQNGVPPVHLLHGLHIKTALLHNHNKQCISDFLNTNKFN